jgi:D-arginine dehydrogenase
VIGAGFAGAATAYHLARRGARSVHILEQEPVAGVHSSGRNAAFLRQVIADPAIARLAAAGTAFIQTPPSDWPIHVEYNPIGSLLQKTPTPTVSRPNAGLRNGPKRPCLS